MIPEQRLREEAEKAWGKTPEEDLFLVGARFAEAEMKEALGWKKYPEKAKLIRYEQLKYSQLFMEDLVSSMQETQDLMFAKIEIMREALDKISNLFVTVDNGRFGAFVSAEAVDISRSTLKKLDLL